MILPNQLSLLLPAEREAISALLEADDALMTHLKTELKMREEQLEHISSRLQAERTRLVQLEPKLTVKLNFKSLIRGISNSLSSGETQTTAIPYHTNLPENVITPIAGPDEGTSPGSPLVRFHDDYINSTSQSLQRVPEVAQATSREVGALKQDIQASLRVEKLAMVSVDMVKKQIAHLEDAITLKKDRFRAIWKIPTEIWSIIFLKCCRVDCEISGSGWVNMPTRMPNTMP